MRLVQLFAISVMSVRTGGPGSTKTRKRSPTPDVIVCRRVHESLYAMLRATNPKPRLCAS